MDVPSIDQRIVRGRASTLTLAPTDQEGAPTTLAAPVAVEVLDHAGDAVTSGPATVVDDVWTFDIAASDAQLLDRWTVSWTDATDSTWTTLVEVTGGHTVTVAQVLAHATDLADFTPDEVIAARLVAETEAEWICDLAFTPRLATLVLDGDGGQDLHLPVNACRQLRSITVAGTTVTGLTVDPDGLVHRPTPWPVGRSNIAVAVEVGLDAAPPDLRHALCMRIGTILKGPDTNVPLQAVQWQPEAGGSYRLDRASRFRCGIPEVDAVYFRYSRRTSIDDDARPAAASRPWQLDPSSGSLFHGGVR